MVTVPSTICLPLSPFDQAGGRLYVHKFFFFPFPNKDLTPEASAYLKARVVLAVKRWPFLAGFVGPSSNEENEIEARYLESEPDSVVDNVLTVKHLSRDEFPYTYPQLAEAGVPPSVMNMRVLSSVPEWPAADKTYPAAAIQANFFPGGIILCFAFHHAIADGGSFITFLKEFGAGGEKLPETKSGMAPNALRRMGYLLAPDYDRVQLTSLPEYCPLDDPVRAPSSKKVTTRILQFSANTVKSLEQAINKYLKSTVGPTAFASNIASLSSLVWVAVIRARQGRLHPSNTAKIGIAVNFLAVKQDPKLPADYFGNAIVHVNATAKVDELLQLETSANIDGINSKISVTTVALAAWRMRQATQAVNAEYVDERHKTFSALEDPTEVPRAYEKAMDTSNTGIDFSSWRDQGADIAFGIPGTESTTPEFWRKAWSPNEGAYNILPRKGGSKGDAVWEVSLGLSVEDMDRVCAGDELGGWVVRVLE